MTDPQQKWMNDHPQFSTIGPPRPVRFDEWGSLSADGTYERLDNQPRKPIQVGNWAIGVCIIAETPHDQ